MPFFDRPIANCGEMVDKHNEACNQIITTMRELPVNEFSYYIALLISAIKNENKPEQYQELLDKSLVLVNALSNFYKKPEKEKNLEELNKAVSELIDASKTKTTSYQIKKIILAICSSITCVLVGALGAVVGLSSGFLFNYTIIGNFRGAGLGFVIGTALGAYVGWRIPEAAFKSAFERKLEICIHHINKLSNELSNRELKENKLGLIETDFSEKGSEGAPELSDDEKLANAEKAYEVFSQGMPGNTALYIENTKLKVKKDLITKYFTEKRPEGAPELSDDEKLAKAEKAEKDYDAFLLGDTTFQVCTTTARFIDKSLKGNLGHHALIRYKINGIEARATPIEFGSPSKAPNFVDQSEKPRKVKGQKLVDMLVLHSILQETHPYKRDFMLNHYDLGSNDCLTYVNKILIGTDQAPTQMKRFNREVDKLPGIYCVSNIVGFFSHTRQDEIDSYRKFAYPGVDLPTNLHRWEDRSPIWAKEKNKKGEEELVQVQWREWWDDEPQDNENTTPTLSRS